MKNNLYDATVTQSVQRHTISFRIPVWVEISSLLQNVQTRFVTHEASYEKGYRIICEGKLAVF